VDDLEATARHAARVLLIDGQGRLLLLHGLDPARPEHGYWFTVGGGIDPGETPAQAAARELAEETGLVLGPQRLGEPVWHEVTSFSFDGHWYRQEQEFFVARVEAWEPVQDGFNHVERASIDAYRWWSLDELSSTEELVYPAELAGLLRGILGG
jgi:8-oxo-dGTP pyrophosphatase MutT (NUDIX family)